MKFAPTKSMSTKLKSYFQLMRLPNAFTAMADPLAGVLVAAGSQFSQLPKMELVALLGVSACLYTAGIIFNDLFDLEEDRQYRPERPLPSGRITPRAARWLAIGLMGVGLLLAGWITLKPLLHYGARISELIVARPALGLAIALAGLILSYDYALKRFPVLRELGMGTCRAMNFALGLTFGFQVREPSPEMWLPAAFLLVYVAALTASSRLENRIPATRLAVKWLVLGIIVLDAVFVLTFHPHEPILALWVLALLAPALVLGKFLAMA